MMNWYELWCDDYEALIATAEQNLHDDLEAGYDPNGKSIAESRAVVQEFTDRYEAGLNSFVDMTEQRVNRWCYYDLKRRGAI